MIGLVTILTMLVFSSFGLLAASGWTSSLSTSISPSSTITSGTSAHDTLTVTLTNNGPPLGTVYAYLYSGTCSSQSGGALQSFSTAVTGSGMTTYNTPSYTFNSAGSFVYLTYYSGTSGGYPRSPASGYNCEALTVTQASTTTVISTVTTTKSTTYTTSVPTTTTATSTKTVTSTTSVPTTVTTTTTSPSTTTQTSTVTSTTSVPTTITSTTTSTATVTTDTTHYSTTTVSTTLTSTETTSVPVTTTETTTVPTTQTVTSSTTLTSDITTTLSPSTTTVTVTVTPSTGTISTGNGVPQFAPVSLSGLLIIVGLLVPILLGMRRLARPPMVR